jgi:hypothetical protein
MATATETARSVEEFVEIVSEVREEWELSELTPWFRGHANADWSLIPKFYRQPDKDRDTEDNLREVFITCAPTFSDVKPTNKWDWYFLMQHHGAYTRLLDWSEGALIGLYFAVRENPGHHHAAVWVLNPWKLNQQVVRKFEVVPPGDPGTTDEDKARYDPWLLERFARRRKWPRWSVAVYPSHITRRIGAQRASFTIHGADQRGLEATAERIQCPLKKITIPSWEAKVIRRSLETCGLDETTVFPDLEGLSRAVVYSWATPDEGLPHRGVYTRLAPSHVDRGGVGVFAIRKIRRGTPLFVGDNDEMVWVENEELPQAPRSVRKLYDDFAVIKTVEKGKKREKSRYYGCPLSFNRLTVSWYLNEPLKSVEPNVRCDPSSYEFFASRDIEPGEELTVDYSTYSEQPGRGFRAARPD